MELHYLKGKRVGLVAGSFDPLTLGQLEHLKRSAEGVDVLNILVTSNPNRFPNMFTYQERGQMIDAALINEAGIDVGRFNIRPFLSYLIDLSKRGEDPDLYLVARNGRLSAPLSYALTKIGKRNGEYGLKMPDVQVTGRELRSLIRDGGEWKHLVPRATVDIVYKRLASI